MHAADRLARRFVDLADEHLQGRGRIAGQQEMITKTMQVGVPAIRGDPRTAVERKIVDRARQRIEQPARFPQIAFRIFTLPGFAIAPNAFVKRANEVCRREQQVVDEQVVAAQVGIDDTQRTTQDVDRRFDLAHVEEAAAQIVEAADERGSSAMPRRRRWPDDGGSMLSDRDGLLEQRKRLSDSPELEERIAAQS